MELKGPMCTKEGSNADLFDCNWKFMTQVLFIVGEFKESNLYLLRHSLQLQKYLRHALQLQK